MRKRSFKLKIEPMPPMLWGQNLRTALGKNRWDKLRKGVMQKSCVICGSAEKLEAHEVWDYRERARVSVAKLMGINPLCTKCHDVIHWGSTLRLAEEGKISQQAIIGLRRHFRTVNKCLQKDFDRHVAESGAIAFSRSLMNWRIDWGKYKSAVKDAAEAQAAWAAANPMHDVAADYQITAPGHHMPSKCPACGSPALRLIEQDTSGMSEGEEADYSQGIWGVAICRNCGREVNWGF
jgi:hypothetical protein